MMTMATQRPTTRAADPRFTVSPLVLTEAQAEVADTALDLLGIPGGYVSGEQGITDADARQAVSRAAAHAIGLTLPAGHEIALCVDCLHYGDGEQHREGADYGLRCEDCEPAHRRELGE